MTQREIKFRAWDNKSKEFVNPREVYMSLNDGWCFNDVFDDGYDSINLEQYTGLKDKNGKEIYESDIVRAKGWEPSLYTIEFKEGGFCATHKDVSMPIDINHFYDSTGCSIEIIGNIHQHPELLK